jgi:hypothetical protein
MKTEETNINHYTLVNQSKVASTDRSSQTHEIIVKSERLFSVD